MTFPLIWTLMISLQALGTWAGFQLTAMTSWAAATTAANEEESDTASGTLSEWWTECEDQWNDALLAHCEVRDYTVAASGTPSEGAWIAEFRIRVPGRSDIAVRTHNGPLHVERVTGSMDLQTLNGPLALIDLEGAVQAHTLNGPLSVVLGGSRWNGAGLEALADNGPLSLTMPENYSARLRTGTVNGPVSVDLGSTFGGTMGGTDRPIEDDLFRSGKRATVTLGSGGPPVHVMTTNGPFSIQLRH